MYVLAIKYTKIDKNKFPAYETKNLRSGKLKGNHNNTVIKYCDLGKHEGWLQNKIDSGGWGELGPILRSDPSAPEGLAHLSLMRNVGRCWKIWVSSKLVGNCKGSKAKKESMILYGNYKFNTSQFQGLGAIAQET